MIITWGFHRKIATRLCKVNPDDLKQSWDRRACKRGVSSASFQLLKLETGTCVGLFLSLILSTLLQQILQIHLGVFSPLFPHKPTTPANYAPVSRGTAVISCWSRQFPRSPPGSPFKLQIRLRTACLNLRDFPIRGVEEISALSRVSMTSSVAWPCWPPDRISSSEPGRAIWASVYGFRRAGTVWLPWWQCFRGLLTSQPLALCSRSSDDLFRHLGFLALP